MTVAADGIGTDIGEDLPSAMARVAKVVEAALETLMPAVDEAEGRLIDAMRYATLGGGKRLRAFLVMESAALFGVSVTCAARVAASVEMLHAYSLVHDDLPAMDDDDLRRGRPTVHKKFDEATAILAGDALLTEAFTVLADPATHPDGAVRAKLVAELAAASGAKGMVGGQMIDLLAGGLSLDQGGLTRLQNMKTGCLIAASCRLGAILGDAGDRDCDALAAYGIAMGLAFQIADDVLDVESSAAVTGKATGKDAAAGKATFVSRLGLEGAKTYARELAETAARHLAIFGERAGVLRQAAFFAVERRS